MAFQTPQEPPTPPPPTMPPVMPPRPAHLKPHRSAVVLVLGILAIALGCFGVVLGPIALVMGKTDLAEMNRGSMDPAGRANTNAGRVCGIIGLCIGIFWLLYIITIFVVYVVTLPTRISLP
jgi:hypothetical protein